VDGDSIPLLSEVASGPGQFSWLRRKHHHLVINQIVVFVTWSSFLAAKRRRNIVRQLSGLKAPNVRAWAEASTASAGPGERAVDFL